jgi:hypothetical protein
MRDGKYEGKGLEHPKIRALFTRENLLSSDWYAARIRAKQQTDVQLWQRNVDYLEKFLTKSSYADEASRLGVRARAQQAAKTLAAVKKPAYRTHLIGSIGTDPCLLPPTRPKTAKPKAKRKVARS